MSPQTHASTQAPSAAQITTDKECIEVLRASTPDADAAAVEPTVALVTVAVADALTLVRKLAKLEIPANASKDETLLSAGVPVVRTASLFRTAMIAAEAGVCCGDKRDENAHY